MVDNRGKVSGIIVDNPDIAKAVDEEVSIKTPEQAAYADAEAAIRAERIAKNKVNEVTDAFESNNMDAGAYGASLKRAEKLQSLSSAGRTYPAPTADDVAEANAALADATKKVDEVVATPAP